MIRPKSVSMPYGIQGATLAEFHEINRIQSDAFTTPWSKDLIRGAIANTKYDVRVIMADQGSVAGFYIAHTIHDRSNLDNLAVDAPVRGIGYGGRLIQDWIDRAEMAQMATLSLQVNTRNTRAQELYFEFKFEKTRLLAGYYPNRDDAYQMELAIASDAMVKSR